MINKKPRKRNKGRRGEIECKRIKGKEKMESRGSMT